MANRESVLVECGACVEAHWLCAFVVKGTGPTVNRLICPRSGELFDKLLEYAVEQNGPYFSVR